jgi:hypothetical protein
MGRPTSLTLKAVRRSADAIFLWLRPATAKNLPRDVS